MKKPQNIVRNYFEGEEAISVLKELLDNFSGLDDHSLDLASPNASMSTSGGHQIIIRKPLNEKTKNCIQDILTKHQLAYLEKPSFK